MRAFFKPAAVRTRWFAGSEERGDQLCRLLQAVDVLRGEGVGNIDVDIDLPHDSAGAVDQDDALGACLQAAGDVVGITGDVGDHLARLW